MKIAIIAVLLFAPAAFAEQCDISLEINPSKAFYTEGETVSFVNRLSSNSYDFVVEYWVEDELGNIIKNKINSSSSSAKKFTPKTMSDIIIRARIISLGCEDTGISDNYAEKKVYFAGNKNSSSMQNLAVSFDVGLSTQSLMNSKSMFSGNEESRKKAILLRIAPYLLLAAATSLSIAFAWKR